MPLRTRITFVDHKMPEPLSVPMTINLQYLA